MCLFTHFAAGALAGGLTGNVWLGAAAGAASHAVLDAIPHYDHPDWRLELSGGVFSLLLLLLMPFATVPAVVGGLFGMLPDLENLFQKLGKMRRDQFIFPSHTGLIPHGRTLGPRTLVWQVAIFLICFGLLGVLTPGTASAATGTRAQPVMGDPVVRVLSTNANLTRIQVECPVVTHPEDWDAVRLEDVQWARPLFYEEDGLGNVTALPPRVFLSLAVPTLSAPTVNVAGLDWWKEPSAPVLANEMVSFGAPAVFRTVPITGSDLPLGFDGGVLRSLVIEIQHQPSFRFSEQLMAAAQEDPANKNAPTLDRAPSSLLNQDLFMTLSRGGRVLMSTRNKSSVDRGQFNHFDLTNNWVRLTINDAGLYQLTGQELSAMGVSTNSVDPGKLRLYRGGSFQLMADPAVAEADQADRVGLTEIPIQVLGAGDGEWNLDDEIRFHAFGTDFWADRVDVDADHLKFYNHPYENDGVYWLTWEDVSTASPIPGSPLRVTEISTPANGGDLVANSKLRLHMEQQNKDSQGVIIDNWSWDNSIYYTKTLAFNINDPIPDSSSTFLVEFRGHPNDAPGGTFMANAWVNNDTDHNASTTFPGNAQPGSLQIRIVGESTEMVSGNNILSFQNADPDRDTALVLDSYDIFYWTALDLAAIGGQLDFGLWREHTTVDGQLVDLHLTVPTNDEVILWEIGTLQDAAILRGDLLQSQLTCGLTLDTTHDRHFLATTERQLHRVASGQIADILDLRVQPNDAHYIVVYADGFGGQAENLAEFHSSYLPGIDNPKTYAVSANDIYDSYSGGQKDIFAIRNYLKSVFEDGGGNLRYVCLLGNGTRDHRNYKNQNSTGDLLDLLPAHHRNFFPRNPTHNSTNSPYGSDDSFVSFDTPPGDYDVDFPDVAIGRLPAVSNTEAADLVDRMIEYSSFTEPGLWSNGFVMVADDCVTPSTPRWPEPYRYEHRHTAQAEDLWRDFIPRSIDMNKIYGAVYDFPPGSSTKPQVRLDINAALSAGTSIFHYIGHGAENNLADEQIFQSQDIANLTNDMKRFAFIAFSCDVGVYDSPSRRSMAELFVIANGGGAIAAICASQVSWISSNDFLSDAFYFNLYPSLHVAGDQTLSEALLLAKASMTSSGYRHNSQRYNLLSDSALSLPNPVDDLTFSDASLDTIRAGARQVVVLEESGGLILGPGDIYQLGVEESSFDHHYIYGSELPPPPETERVPLWTSYEERGSAVFDGYGTMNSSELRVPFKVPVQLRYGDRSRLRLILTDPDETHVAFELVSAIRSATGPSDDIVGPQIDLAFEDNRYRVRAGDEMTAVLQDTSSIAILGTTPGNSLTVEFDDSGFMTDVTHAFIFDPNSYTSGRLSFQLPGDLPLGDHMVALHASDVLGNVGNDTISFLLVADSIVGMDSITLFPNPTPGPCRLIFELSDPMLVKWDIYTLSGHRIKSLQEDLSAGPQILPWDGRDDQGDEIANGTYLYVLRGHVTGGGERDITETGKLVIMR